PIPDGQEKRLEEEDHEKADASSRNAEIPRRGSPAGRGGRRHDPLLQLGHLLQRLLRYLRSDLRLLAADQRAHAEEPHTRSASIAWVWGCRPPPSPSPNPAQSAPPALPSPPAAPPPGGSPPPERGSA